MLTETVYTGKWFAEQLDKVIVSQWSTNTSQPDIHNSVKIARLLDFIKFNK